LHGSRKLAVLVGVIMLAAVISTASAAGGAPSSIPVLPDSQLNPKTITLGGAKALSTTHTVAHWFGQALNPDNNVTYGFNMVGSDPGNCSGSACSTTVTADIIPVNVVVGGETFNGTDVVQPTLDSPVFSTSDYGSTPNATAAGSFPNPPELIRGAGGALSQGDAGNQLQLEDATMRAQFNRTGASPYHVRLNPVVQPAITLTVPSGRGVVLQSGRGVHFADVAIDWWGPEIQKLNQTLGYIDPTHLPIYLTNNVVNYIGSDPNNCCVIGFHGASEVLGHGTGSTHGNGNQTVQTYAFASYTSPGFFARANGGTDWALQDIHALSHEVSEWADDPFVNNKVEPWVTPTAPQYGCTNVLETGDPVVGIGFAIGTNTYLQGPNPNGSQSADGYYHPEDEVFMPWFMRQAPNTTSEPTQATSTNGGRYTLMGDLNPFPGFRAPATGC
jgi:hypothetical protein